jgi:hypothetical protein
MLNNFLFRLCDNVEKYDRGRQATDDNIIRLMNVGICMLDNSGKNTNTFLLLVYTYCYIIDQFRLIS